MQRGGRRQGGWGRATSRGHQRAAGGPSESTDSACVGRRRQSGRSAALHVRLHPLGTRIALTSHCGYLEAAAEAAAGRRAGLAEQGPRRRGSALQGGRRPRLHGNCSHGGHVECCTTTWKQWLANSFPSGCVLRMLSFSLLARLLLADFITAVHGCVRALLGTFDSNSCPSHLRLLPRLNGVPETLLCLYPARASWQPCMTPGGQSRARSGALLPVPLPSRWLPSAAGGAGRPASACRPPFPSQPNRSGALCCALAWTRASSWA